MQDGSEEMLALRERMAPIGELLAILALADALMETTRVRPGHEDPWSDVYDAVFSDLVSARVRDILAAMGDGLDYYDPDTSYEEDVRAFVEALRGKTAELRATLAEVALPVVFVAGSRERE